METDDKNSVEHTGEETPASQKVKLMRAERYQKIAMQLESFNEDSVRSLCVALLVPLTNKQIEDLLNQLENIGDNENDNKNN